MSESQEIIAEVNSTLQAIERIYSDFIELKDTKLPELPRDKWSARLVAGVLNEYYSCCESVFLKISQHFENHLAHERWHTDLLHKMGLEIPGLRPRVLSNAALVSLRELLGFRHFARHSAPVEYDWRKLEYLMTLLGEGHSALLADITKFKADLEKIKPIE
jgi:hypothetical protein